MPSPPSNRARVSVNSMTFRRGAATEAQSTRLCGHGSGALSVDTQRMEIIPAERCRLRTLLRIDECARIANHAFPGFLRHCCPGAYCPDRNSLIRWQASGLTQPLAGMGAGRSLQNLPYSRSANRSPRSQTRGPEKIRHTDSRRHHRTARHAGCRLRAHDPRIPWRSWRRPSPVEFAQRLTRFAGRPQVAARITVWF